MNVSKHNWTIVSASGERWKDRPDLVYVGIIDFSWGSPIIFPAIECISHDEAIGLRFRLLRGERADE